jgi:hypothetical protein
VTADARRMPRRGILRITWTAIMTLEQPRIFIAVAERQRVTHKWRRYLRQGRSREPTDAPVPPMSMFGVSGAKADGALRGAC